MSDRRCREPPIRSLQLALQYLHRARQDLENSTPMTEEERRQWDAAIAEFRHTFEALGRESPA